MITKMFVNTFFSQILGKSSASSGSSSNSQTKQNELFMLDIFIMAFVRA